MGLISKGCDISTREKRTPSNLGKIRATLGEESRMTIRSLMRDICPRSFFQGIELIEFMTQIGSSILPKVKEEFLIEPSFKTANPTGFELM